MTDTTDEPLPPNELEQQAASYGFGGTAASSTNGSVAQPKATTSGFVPPHDNEAEAAVVGAMLNSRLAIVHVVDCGLTASDYYDPAHGHIHGSVFRVAATGADADPLLVRGDLQDRGLLDAIGGRETISRLYRDAPPHSSIHDYITRIKQLARLRNIDVVAHDIRAAIADHNEHRVDALIEDLTGRAYHRGDRSISYEDLDSFLDGEDEEYDWLIPGLLERTDRVMLTGPEGGGKSTLIRQMAVQAAAGIHPFTLEPIEPVRVLLLDLENPRKLLRRALRPLRTKATKASEGLTVSCHPDGLDLTDAGDVRRIERLIEETQPDFVCGGPIYKLVGGDPIEEGPAKTAALTMDRLRTTYGFSLLLETHQPHENGGKRPERPYGASLWKRWPEFGLHLGAAGPLRHWRGARDERAWPTHLQRGGAWPWTVAEIPADPNGATFDDYRRDIVAHLSEHPDAEWTQNKLENAVMERFEHPRAGIRKALDDLARDKQIEKNPGGRGAKVYTLPTARLIDQQDEEL